MSEPIVTPRAQHSSHGHTLGPSSLRLETIPSQSLQPPDRTSNLALFSPVNEAGSFEFDRLIKSGSVLKRRKRRNTWNAVRLVLRPNSLSIYKNQDETILRHSLNMAEVQAVALRKDIRRKGDHEGTFGVFTASRNFHFEAESKEEALAWINAIRTEARMEDQKEDMVIVSPGGKKKTYAGFTQQTPLVEGVSRTSRDSSSFDGGTRSRASSSAVQHTRPIPIRQRSSNMQDTSGSEYGTYSDSEAAFGSAREFSPLSYRHARDSRATSLSASQSNRDNFYLASHPRDDMNESRASMLDAARDENRVIWQGFLQVLKSRRGVKTWKRCWVVLRPRHLALYKNEEEYSALLILPIDSIVDAMDTDSVSKGKEHCMQLICEERSYRFCADNEDDLTKWLGALKSVLSRRKDPARG